MLDTVDTQIKFIVFIIIIIVIIIIIIIIIIDRDVDVHPASNSDVSLHVSF